MPGFAIINTMNIKVISLNLWHGNLFSTALKFLEDANADILMLQEVYNGTDPNLRDGLRAFTVLQQKLGYKYADFAPALIMNREEGRILQGNAVLSKFPLKSHEPVFYREPFGERNDSPDDAPIMPRNLQHVEATTPVGVVNVFNTQGVWDLVGENYSERRKEMSQKMIAATKGKTNVILAGDTNAKQDNQAMLNVEKHLTNVFAHKERLTSFNLRRKDLKKFPGYATAIVDLMYVSADVKIIAHDSPDADISDHLPLTATLKIG
jgi:endonuclease/exonuclease/phosphatase family metal-dependent hydrolase